MTRPTITRSPDTLHRMRPARWLALGLILSFTACGEIVEETDSDLERVPFSPSVKAKCNVKVSGYGTVSIEDNYLPHVLFCEIASAVAKLPHAQKMEALEAQAIAARTFTYYRLSWKSTLSNSVFDQVYKDSHCMGTPAKVFYDAVNNTRGMVLLRSNGTMHHGYYRAGSSVCKKHGTCDGQPCMGQRNAATCASQGRTWRYILDLSYDYPLVVRASGSCVPGGGGSIPGPTVQDCYYQGIRGTCQDSSDACTGNYQPGLCPGGGNVQCCLPPAGQQPTWGGCVHNGEQGTCQENSIPCDGFYQGGLCPGPSDVQCCLPQAAAPDYGTCNFNNHEGKCQDTSFGCDGFYQSGLCPGPGTVKCCLPPAAIPSFGSCNFNGQEGNCQSNTMPCGGSYHAGLCPGPTSVQCCVP